MTFEYRIYPTVEQAEQIDQWLEICCKVYNHALAERRDWIRSRKCAINACSLRAEYILPADAPRPTYALQCKSLSAAKKDYPDLKTPYSQVLQQTLSILEKAFVGMWEQGRGFPRFKRSGKMRSFVYPQFKECPVVGDATALPFRRKATGSGCLLRLPKLGDIEMRLHRPIPDSFTVKQVRIMRRASGYYAMLSLQADVSVPDIQPHGYPIGIDVGLNAFVATSEGELIKRPRFFVDAQHRLKVLNRDVSRKKKGSQNFKKSIQRLARYHERISQGRKDYHFKTSYHLCSNAGMIFAEELNLKALAKGMLSKHCLDAGWGQFLNTLEWVCWKQGVFFAKVPAPGTSQTCPTCEASVPKDLNVRVHHCPECGYQTDRDVASSQVICNRGLAAVGHIAEVSGGERVAVLMKEKLSGAILGSPRYSACT